MRLVFSVVLSLLVTLALFWFMQWLITSGQQELARPEDRMQVEIVRVRQDEEVQEREREPPRPPQQDERPPPPPMEQLRTTRPNLSGVGISTPRIETGVTGGAGIGSMQEGDPIPVATIPPQYPREAQMQGIEGYVRIEFTINPDGSVSDARVIDAQPRRGIFDREALRAISRWRFRPKVEDGVAVPSRGAYTIDFTMGEG